MHDYSVLSQMQMNRHYYQRLDPTIENDKLTPENLLRAPSVFSFFATLAFIRPDVNEPLSLLGKIFVGVLDAIILFDIEKEVLVQFPKEQVC